MKKAKVIAIVGPTASGKTSLSIELAKKFNGEVISCDSRQIYRGLDLGSGKVTKTEMEGIPHHLLDVVEPDTVFTGNDFVEKATHAIETIHKNNHIPIVVGGTFFWLDLLRGKIKSSPVAPNTELRAKLEDSTTEELYEMLYSLDERRALSIDKHNKRRLIRALEIVSSLGIVPNYQPTKSPYEWQIIGIETERETLHKAIHTRLLQRMDAGMVKEVEQLHAKGISYERLDELGLEYRYIAKYLQGELNKEEMLDMLETKIHQFAKRQLTWLKRDDEIEWFLPENFGEIFRRTKEFLSE